MNIEEYAAQFPIIEREEIVRGQTVLAHDGEFAMQQFASMDKTLQFPVNCTLRLVKDIVPRVEDGFYVDCGNDLLKVMTDSGGHQKVVQRGWSDPIDLFTSEWVSGLVRLYTPAELAERLTVEGFPLAGVAVRGIAKSGRI